MTQTERDKALLVIGYWKEKNFQKDQQIRDLKTINRQLLKALKKAQEEQK